MPVFPQLRSGAVAQYPLSQAIRWRTAIQRFQDGTEQRMRLLQRPRLAWEIRLADLDEEEAAAVQRFYEECQGRLTVFSFVDPLSGATYPRCRLASDEWTVLWRGETSETALVIVTEPD